MNRLPLCARIGILHGLIVGFFFALWRIETGFAPLAVDEFFWGWLLVSLVALLCSLFILIVVERYLVGGVLWPVLVNAILVGFLTALVINFLPAHRFFLLAGVWIGILIGLVVGLLLCRLCFDRLIVNRDAGGNYGR